MFSPLVTGPIVQLDKNGTVAVEIENLKDSARVGPHLRVIDIECPKHLIYHSLATSKGRLTLQWLFILILIDTMSPNTSDLYNPVGTTTKGTLLMQGHYIIAQCPYAILTQQVQADPVNGGGVPNYLECDTSTVRLTINTGTYRGKKLQIRRVGMCTFKGELPRIEPYLRYRVLCKLNLPEGSERAKPVNGSGNNNRATRVSAENGFLQDFEFVILQVLHVHAPTDLRYSDLQYVLEKEAGMVHLYQLLVKDYMTVRSNQSSPLMRSLWLPDCDSVNYALACSHIQKSTWHLIHKYNKLWTIFPVFMHLILTRMSETDMRRLYDYVRIPANMGTLVTKPTDLMLKFPETFLDLLVGSDGCPCSESALQVSDGLCDGALDLWLNGARSLPSNRRVLTLIKLGAYAVLTPNWKVLVNFYNDVLLGEFQESGSTLAVFNSHTLARVMHMQRYQSLFCDSRSLNDFLDDKNRAQSACTKLEPETHAMLNESTQSAYSVDITHCKALNETRLSEVLSLCESMLLIHKVTAVSLKAEFQQSFERDNADKEVPPHTTMEAVPNGCYTLTSMWDCAKAIHNRLLELGAVKRANMGKGSGISDHVAKFLLNSVITDTGDQHYRFKKNGSVYDLTDQQSCVLLASTLCPVLSVIGMPGTGKTLVIEALYDFYDGNSGKVAVVTQGGCMADALKERGIHRAKTIHMALSHCYMYNRLKCVTDTTDECPLLPPSDMFDYDQVQVLIIDEFSNVGDYLAAAIYSKQCFPNLVTIIHHYDPLQTAPIEPGSLSIDYMQCFPKADVVVNDIIQSADKLGVLEEKFNVATVQEVGLKYEMYKKELNKQALVMRMLVSALVIDSSELITSGYYNMPIGMSLRLTKKQRFAAESLIAKNDLLLAKGAFVPFEYSLEETLETSQMQKIDWIHVRPEIDWSRLCAAEKMQQHSFKAYPCVTVLPSQLDRQLGELNQRLRKQIMTGTQQDSRKLLQSLSDKSPLLNYIVQKLFLYHNDNHIEYCWTLGESCLDRFQMLTLTNSVATQVNNLVNRLHIFMLSWFTNIENAAAQLPNDTDVLCTERDSPSPLCSNFKEYDSPVDLGVRAFVKGSKILIREAKPGIETPCQNITDVDSVRRLFREAVAIIIPKMDSRALPKPGDFIEPPATKSVPFADLAINVDDDDDWFLKYDIQERLEYDLKHITIADLLPHGADRIARMLDIIKPRQVRNGFTFVLYGYVDFCTEPISCKIFAESLGWRVAAICADLSHFTRETTGAGSRKLVKDARRRAILKYRKLFTIPELLKRLSRLDLSRWWSPPPTPGLTPSKENSSDPSKVISPVLSKVAAKNIYGDAQLHRVRFLVTTSGQYYRLDKRFISVDMLQFGWAITVNFSQGREYDSVALVIPNQNEPTTRSMTGTVPGPDALILLHTKFAEFDRTHIHVAITRPKTEFVLFGDKSALQIMAQRNNVELTTRLTLMSYILKMEFNNNNNK